MTAALYRAWIQTLPSALDGRSFSEWVHGEGRNPACHVRRAGESGTGYKAPFAEIPLTHVQHDYQHRYGELACLAKFTRDPDLRARLKAAKPEEAERIAKDWFTESKAKYYARWLEETPEGRAWSKSRAVEAMA